MLRICLLLMIMLIYSFSSCKKDDADVKENPVNWITPVVDAPNTKHLVFFSKSAAAEVSFHICLPLAYDHDTTKSFPVLYWLHGSGGGGDGIPVLVDFFSKAILNGKIAPMIIVFPNGLPHGMWCNSKDGKQPVEDMFINDLIPFVDSSFRTIDEKRGRIVEGFSMGGYGAARFGFKYNHIFAAFSMMGAGPMQLDFSVVAPHNQAIQPIIYKDVYGEDMSYFEAQSPWRLAEQFGHKLQNPTPKRVVVGKSDFTYMANLDFHNHLDSLSIPHQYRAFEDIDHSLGPLFSALGENNWGFYNAVFK